MTIGAIVLAAGKGTRMNTGRAKVLHEACGRTLLGWAFASMDAVEVDGITVVVGHQADEVAATCADEVAIAVQEPQRGTGHAAQVGLAALDAKADTVLVLPGDMPLLSAETLSALVEVHRAEGADATVLTVELDDPAGYGRIIRSDGRVEAIREDRDASELERKISEVNTSVYVFARPALERALSVLGTDNVQAEYYLTDTIGLIVADGGTVSAFVGAPEEGIGVNTQAQLAEVAEVIRGRINGDFLDRGVWMLDPMRVYIDAGVTVEPGAKLHPDIYLSGSTSIAADAEIGPNVQLHDTIVGERARVQQAVASQAVIGEGALVGPFAYLRPGAELSAGSKVGTYVEVKASIIGEGTKVPHLSYIGDTTIGAGSNIGAGTVTVNYDGSAKHRTVIGDGVRIGADTMLIAPVEIGDGAYTGAGSVITEDVPEGALAVSRPTQKNVDGYAERRRRRAEGDDS